MDNKVGPWVSGADFHGREVELALFIERLERGEHLSLVAQRRVGKTSLLRETAVRLRDRLTCLYVDLEDAHDAADAIVAIALAAHEHTSLWTRVQGAFTNVLANLEEIGVDVLTIRLRDGLVGDWRTKADRIVADLAATSPSVVLMLDELPVLLVRMLRDERGAPRPGGREQADPFLSWLRKAALAHAGALRVVVTGSIGLESVARQAGLSGTLNAYAPFLLAPWSAAVACDALAALCVGRPVTLTPGAAHVVTERLGSCIPYHVQLFYSLLEDDARRRREAVITHEDVARVYEHRMLSSHGHAELAHMEERLRLVVQHEVLPLVLDLLTEAAVVGELTAEAARALALDDLPVGTDPAAVLRDVFGVLEHDGYLETVAPGRRRFVSRLLRDWWRARFGEFHVRAHDRERT